VSTVLTFGNRYKFSCLHYGFLKIPVSIFWGVIHPEHYRSRKVNKGLTKYRNGKRQISGAQPLTKIIQIINSVVETKSNPLLSGHTANW
jgi:hypothetical protein